MWYLFLISLLPLLLLTDVIADSSDSVAENQNACLPGETLWELIVITELVVFQVTIDTFISQNTLINIGSKYLSNFLQHMKQY